MSRPVGVALIAALILGFSLLTFYRALTQPGARQGRGFLIVCVLLTLLAFIAAHALWGLRAHAFSMFLVWAICAMVAVVMLRLRGPGAAHPVRVLPPIVYTGIVFAAAALYLRRAV